MYFCDLWQPVGDEESPLHTMWNGFSTGRENLGPAPAPTSTAANPAAAAHDAADDDHRDATENLVRRQRSLIAELKTTIERQAHDLIAAHTTINTLKDEVARLKAQCDNQRAMNELPAGRYDVYFKKPPGMKQCTIPLFNVGLAPRPKKKRATKRTTGEEDDDDDDDDDDEDAAQSRPFDGVIVGPDGVDVVRIERELKITIKKAYEAQSTSQLLPYVTVDLVPFFTPYLLYTYAAYVLCPRRVTFLVPSWCRKVLCCRENMPHEHSPCNQPDVADGPKGMTNKGITCIKPMYTLEGLELLVTVRYQCNNPPCTATVNSDHDNVRRQLVARDVPLHPRTDWAVSTALMEHHHNQCLGSAASFRSAHQCVARSYGAILLNRMMEYDEMMHRLYAILEYNIAQRDLYASPERPPKMKAPPPDPNDDIKFPATPRGQHEEQHHLMMRQLDKFRRARGCENRLKPHLNVVDLAHFGRAHTKWSFMCENSHRAMILSLAAQCAPLIDRVLLMRACRSISISVDFTFKIMKLTRGPSGKPTAMCTIVADNGDLVAFAVCDHESLQCIQALLSLIRQVNDGSLKFVWTDSCCNTGNKIREVLPFVRVLQDLMHLICRMPPVSKEYQQLRDELARLFRQALWKAFPHAEHLMKNNDPLTLRACDRFCPGPDVLVERITKLRDNTRYSDFVKTPPFQRFFANVLEHAQKGCLSDPVDPDTGLPVPLHTSHSDGSVTCCRGTNLNEQKHNEGGRIAGGVGTSMGPIVVDNIFRTIGYNAIDQSLARNGERRWICLNLNLLARAVHVLKSPAMGMPQVFVDAKQRFFPTFSEPLAPLFGHSYVKSKDDGVLRVLMQGVQGVFASWQESKPRFFPGTQPWKVEALFDSRVHHLQPHHRTTLSAAGLLPDTLQACLPQPTLGALLTQVVRQSVTAAGGAPKPDPLPEFLTWASEHARAVNHLRAAVRRKSDVPRSVAAQDDVAWLHSLVNLKLPAPADQLGDLHVLFHLLAARWGTVVVLFSLNRKEAPLMIAHPGLDAAVPPKPESCPLYIARVVLPVTDAAEIHSIDIHGALPSDRFKQLADVHAKISELAAQPGAVQSRITLNAPGAVDGGPETSDDDADELRGEVLPAAAPPQPADDPVYRAGPFEWRGDDAPADDGISTVSGEAAPAFPALQRHTPAVSSKKSTLAHNMTMADFSPQPTGSQFTLKTTKRQPAAAALPPAAREADEDDSAPAAPLVAPHLAEREPPSPAAPAPAAPASAAPAAAVRASASLAAATPTSDTPATASQASATPAAAVRASASLAASTLTSDTPATAAQASATPAPTPAAAAPASATPAPVSARRSRSSAAGTATAPSAPSRKRPPAKFDCLDFTLPAGASETTIDSYWAAHALVMLSLDASGEHNLLPLRAELSERQRSDILAIRMHSSPALTDHAEKLARKETSNECAYEAHALASRAGHRRPGDCVKSVTDRTFMFYVQKGLERKLRNEPLLTNADVKVILSRKQTHERTLRDRPRAAQQPSVAGNAPAPTSRPDNDPPSQRAPPQPSAEPGAAIISAQADSSASITGRRLSFSADTPAPANDASPPRALAASAQEPLPPATEPQPSDHVSTPLLSAARLKADADERHRAGLVDFVHSPEFDALGLAPREDGPPNDGAAHAAAPLTPDIAALGDDEPFSAAAPPSTQPRPASAIAERNAASADDTLRPVTVEELLAGKRVRKIQPVRTEEQHERPPPARRAHRAEPRTAAPEPSVQELDRDRREPPPGPVGFTEHNPALAQRCALLEAQLSNDTDVPTTTQVSKLTSRAHVPSAEVEVPGTEAQDETQVNAQPPARVIDVDAEGDVPTAVPTAAEVTQPTGRPSSTTSVPAEEVGFILEAHTRPPSSCTPSGILPQSLNYNNYNGERGSAITNLHADWVIYALALTLYPEEDGPWRSGCCFTDFTQSLLTNPAAQFTKGRPKCVREMRASETGTAGIMFVPPPDSKNPAKPRMGHFITWHLQKPHAHKRAVLDIYDSLIGWHPQQKSIFILRLKHALALLLDLAISFRVVVTPQQTGEQCGFFALNNLFKICDFRWPSGTPGIEPGPDNDIVTVSPRNLFMPSAP